MGFKWPWLTGTLGIEALLELLEKSDCRKPDPKERGECHCKVRS